MHAADSHRTGGGSALSNRQVTETQRVWLAWTSEGAFRIVDRQAEADATAVLGPSAVGSFLSVDLVPERTPIGESVAPRVAAALACLDAHFDLGIGELEPARDVRRRS